jgi:hypothetical protein
MTTYISKDGNTMATHKRSQFKLGNVASFTAGSTDLHGFGFSVINQHGSPLFSIVYPTEDEARSAYEAVTSALSNAIAVTGSSY